MKPQHADNYTMNKYNKTDAVSKMRIIPSHHYNPTKKDPSRRDLIRAGFIKRNGQPTKEALKLYA